VAPSVTAPGDTNLSDATANTAETTRLCSLNSVNSCRRKLLKQRQIT